MSSASGTPRIGGTLTILLSVVAVLVLATVIASFSMQGGSKCSAGTYGSSG